MFLGCVICLRGSPKTDPLAVSISRKFSLQYYFRTRISAALANPKVMNNHISPAPAVRVLVAEDHPTTGRALTSLLQRHDYEVELAADGQDAPDILLGTNAPSGGLLDLDMPRLLGLARAARVASDPSG